MKIAISKKSFLRIISTVLLFLLIIKIPLDKAFERILDQETAYYVEKIILSCIIIFFSVFSIKKLGFQYISGLTNPRTSFIFMYLLPLYIAFFSDFTNVKDLVLLDLIIPLTGIVLYAFAEELIFRGLILITLLKNNLHSLTNIKRSVVISAFIFGCTHFVALYTYDFVSVLCQVIYAFIFGLFFGVLLIKGQNIYLLGVVHGIVNLMSRIGSIRNSDNNGIENVSLDENQSNLLSPLIIIFIFMPLLLVAIYLLKRIVITDVLRLQDAADKDIQIR